MAATSTNNQINQNYQINSMDHNYYEREELKDPLETQLQVSKYTIWIFSKSVIFSRNIELDLYPKYRNSLYTQYMGTIVIFSGESSLVRIQQKSKEDRTFRFLRFYRI